MRRVPQLVGEPIQVEFQPRLMVAGKKLVSGADRGVAVHAGAFLRERRLVLDDDLLCHPAELERILIHELFHWVWLRLGNPLRAAWEELIAREVGCKARGELGWSAEWRKKALAPADGRDRNRRWREYLCESFCDTAAWLLGRPHAEHTLANRYRMQRKRWMEHLLKRPLSI